jgi:hypothetical protein
MEPRERPSQSWKKYAAIAMVAVMVASAFVMLAPVATPHTSAPVEKTPARSQAGAREVTYTISNRGESYIKDSRDIDGARGDHSSTLGLNQWWDLRKANYGDTVVHNSFPYSLAYYAEGMYNTQVGVTHVKYNVYSFYRYTIDAKNLTNIKTSSGNDPLYIPVRGALSTDGGTVQLNWHLTYITDDDCVAIGAGTHYANTYYGVPAGGGPLPSTAHGTTLQNDGWYIEHSGKMSFDINAAKKFLGLPGLGALYTEFNTSNAGGAMNLAWSQHYQDEGGAPGKYDITDSYDYDLNESGTSDVKYYLTVDPSSTSNLLVLRMWGYSWGMEALMFRYLDVQGIVSNNIPWPEDWYLNATIGLTGADVHSRLDAQYHMMAWKDSAFFSAAWLIEPSHNDVNALIPPDSGWYSRAYDYIASDPWLPMKQQWAPGTFNIGGDVAYWLNCTTWNLATGEKLVVQLGNGRFQGFVPYKGAAAVDDKFAKGGNDAKAAEISTHQVWGELILGHGFPSSLYSATNYSHATKTLTLVGPTSLPRNPNSNPDYASLVDATGSPQIMMDVSRISNYVLTLPAGPYNPGVPYTLTVTAKNFTGAILNSANPNKAWNGTVNLSASAGVTLGATSHKWSASNNGVWTTTVTFTTGGDQFVRAVDLNSSLDVDDTLLIHSADINIPEFPTLLIPVIAAVVLVVAIRRRK